jgi:hypothetical protein
MYMHGANDVKQTKIHVAEPLVSQTSVRDFKMVNEKMKSCVIPKENIQLGGRTRHCGVRKLIYSVWTR